MMTKQRALRWEPDRKSIPAGCFFVYEQRPIILRWLVDEVIQAYKGRAIVLGDIPTIDSEIEILYFTSYVIQWHHPTRSSPAPQQTRSRWPASNAQLTAPNHSRFSCSASLRRPPSTREQINSPR